MRCVPKLERRETEIRLLTSLAYHHPTTSACQKDILLTRIRDPVKPSHIISDCARSIKPIVPWIHTTISFLSLHGDLCMPAVQTGKYGR